MMQSYSHIKQREGHAMSQGACVAGASKIQSKSENISFKFKFRLIL